MTKLAPHFLLLALLQLRLLNSLLGVLEVSAFARTSNNPANKIVDLGPVASIVAAIKRLPAAHIIGCLRQSARRKSEAFLKEIALCELNLR